MDNQIEVEAMWYITIEEDYEIKNKPPFPPRIKVFFEIPYTKYHEIVNTDNILESYCIDRCLVGKKFGFYIRYNPDKDIYREIENNVHDLNIRYSLNINEIEIIELIKNLYSYDYFRYGDVKIKRKEKIILSKEYIKEGGVKP